MLLFYRPLTKNYFIIEKNRKPTIIKTAFGVSSNGRTRDFGSLYHGSNPCAPTKIKKCPNGAFFNFLGARIRQSEAHGEYADEQLATAQKRIFLIEFLPHGWLLFIKVSCAFQRAKI